ncbi:MAG: Ldh family oxidoreductase [Chloroflexi bacterium]|nr:Ldh family oxidoreductase [Chloroflexota bacterium]
MAEEVTIAADRLRAYVEALFRRAGLSPEDAALAADIQVEADLRGVHTHGVAGVPGYLRQLQAGTINPRPRLNVIRQSGATAVVDGDNGLGQVVSHFAMRQAIDRAGEAGIGIAVACRSNHFGAAAYYAMMASSERLIGYATTNAGARIAAWGGKEPVVGNNPISWAIPAGEEWPIVLDMAQSVVAAGKIGMALRKSEPIPLGWALDREGQPTTDPRVGLTGLLVPIGGPKGFGLAVVTDVLAGVLSGGIFGLQLQYTPGVPTHLARSHCFMAIDPARFLDYGEYAARVDQMIRDVRSSERAPGVDRLYLPGEIEFRLRVERLERGIPLLASVVADLERAGQELGIDEIIP